VMTGDDHRRVARGRLALTARRNPRAGARQTARSAVGNRA
jgi:hypothetical protein